MTPAGGDRDRAAAVRSALRRLVARQGFHGTSMSAVAKEAGVATGTAYVHYASKDDLVLAAYVETKRELGEAAMRGLDPTADAETRFRQLWQGAYGHVRVDPDRARFLLQVDSSPYAHEAHTRAMLLLDGDPFAEAAAGLVELPPLVCYDLAFGPIFRIAATERTLTGPEVDRLCDACWRAVTRAG